MIVLDASVAIKLIVAEPGRDAAIALIGRGEQVVVPDLFVSELSNIFWKKYRLGEVTREQVDQIEPFLEDLVEEYVPATACVAAALDIAIQLDHPFYDCVYLAIAAERDIEFCTADKRLARSVDGTDHAQRLVLIQ